MASMAALAAPAAPDSPMLMVSRHERDQQDAPPTMEIVVAGGGIGGLCAALVLQNEGYDVRVFEKTTAYKPFGGPIQIASNALESLKRIDAEVYQKIVAQSTVIGDRINGLKDGVSNEWFATFDLLSPAKRRDQEVSIVIDRPVLQDILLARVGACVSKGAEVIDCENHGNRVTSILSDGTRVESDLLIGADGIWSKTRKVLEPKPTSPIWSGYTCFAAIAQCVPSDIETVGYKVFLGSRKYFVSVDVGGGRVQWYAFLNIPPKSLQLDPGTELQWLRETQFDDWNDEVHQLLDTTPQFEVEQRDLYDRVPQLKWTQGRICLLGDAAHPMMPNLGQGGGMAIEDALVLGQELRRIGDPSVVPLALKRYAQNRILRAASVQGMSRLSSTILFQYNHPTTLEATAFPPKLRNIGPRSLITRACQGFLQRVAFPLQFEYLFSFPGSLDPQVFAAPRPGDFTTAAASDARGPGPTLQGEAEKKLLDGTPLDEWFSQYW
eukprot:CAMPEP_0119380444 /NCGR_PEP_ID=MMETSP1334-20130426/57008_1 /TAXON_ID=127549 /ORGANISM="Calcidiscus leptoporus, Strain RCC1130" /LENGTH=493 /DNA_ID=CAMNT_0007400277 /DNA_START=216 /DNA_END=1697 /DNA_ORIENTATION=+